MQLTSSCLGPLRRELCPIAEEEGRSFKLLLHHSQFPCPWYHLESTHCSFHSVAGDNGEISVAGDWAEPCIETITTMQVLLQVPAAWPGAPCPGEQAARSEPGGAGIPPFPLQQGSCFPAVSQRPQAARGGRSMPGKLGWFCSISCWQLVISWGTGEERTISVQREAIALENDPVDAVKRMKQN